MTKRNIKTKSGLQSTNKSVSDMEFLKELDQQSKKAKKTRLTDVGNKELTEMGQTKTVPFFIWNRRMESHLCFVNGKDDSCASIYL
ncbi:hypothetical protein LIT38_18045 [Bacillus sp. CMF12]|uniref:hypothetical protein n=1 Tax=Bacillaceae TaxID=186817 RepID=UPI001FB2C2E6|nr:MULTISPECIES: hypothetical protein [Bacillaceae]UOE53990.1 hypothetical protein IRB79_19440 [Cytobacillus oceanisediminis]USK48440.1 hypothetical protein LIT38_18045 [Bacillus sp. CMF12]